MQHHPRHVEAIVEEQVRRWELRRKEQKQQAKEKPMPVITISREFGSQGAAVGKLIAEKFGFSFLDQKLVHAVAEQTGIQERLVSSLDEHVRGVMDEFVASIFAHLEGTAADYIRQVGRIMHTLERHGGAVIVGRGGQFVVDAKHALRVRAVCPYDKRVAGFAERQSLSKADASKQVDATERERHAFYRKHYHQDVTDPSAYDLLVNTGTFSLEQACEITVKAYATKFGVTPKPPST